jgi:hypothetical protein
MCVALATIQRCIARHVDGVVERTQPELNSVKAASRSVRTRRAVLAQNFLGQFFEQNKDYNPTDTTTYLHNIGSRAEVYTLYKAQIIRLYGEQCAMVTQEHLLHIWRKEFSSVKVSNKHGFNKCNTCDALENLKKAAGSPEEHGL